MKGDKSLPVVAGSSKVHCYKLGRQQLLSQNNLIAVLQGINQPSQSSRWVNSTFCVYHVDTQVAGQHRD